jgi:NADH-quinone oxidoreductase subunit N
MSFLDILILLPELFFINLILIFLWAGLYLRFKYPSQSSLAESFTYFTVFLIFLVFILFVNAPFSIATSLLNNFIVTEFEVALKLFTLLVSVLLLLSILNTERALFALAVSVEVNVVRLLIIAAMLLLISVNDLIYLFFIMELYALCSYVLVGYRGKVSVFSAESSLKYFLLGTIFSILMCYSFSVIYLTTGLTNFSSLTVYLSLSNITAFEWQGYDIFYPIISLLLITFFFKLAAAPFHF